MGTLCPAVLRRRCCRRSNCQDALCVGYREQTERVSCCLKPVVSSQSSPWPWLGPLHTVRGQSSPNQPTNPSLSDVAPQTRHNFLHEYIWGPSFGLYENPFRFSLLNGSLFRLTRGLIRHDIKWGVILWLNGGYVKQMDQMRGEVQQERAARQDLECDKMSLERQVLLPQEATGLQVPLAQEATGLQVPLPQ